MKKLTALVLTVICVVPFVYIFSRSLYSAAAYYQVFLAQSQFLTRFWRSLLLSLCIAAGQLMVSVLAGFGFAKCRFPGKNVIFFLMMLLMVMPLQVVLVPNYQLLDQLGLLDTYAALALPMIFVPLGTFIMTQCFRSVPNSLLEAARLDGCSTVAVICRIAVPMSKGGLVCTGLLSFLDGWNMVEQPLTYLKDFSDYPLSVGLSAALPDAPAVGLVGCLLAALPPVMLFAIFQRRLSEGIVAGGEK